MATRTKTKQEEPEVSSDNGTQAQENTESAEKPAASSSKTAKKTSSKSTTSKRKTTRKTTKPKTTTKKEPAECEAQGETPEPVNEPAAEKETVSTTDAPDEISVSETDFTSELDESADSAASTLSKYRDRIKSMTFSIDDIMQFAEDEEEEIKKANEGKYIRPAAGDRKRILFQHKAMRMFEQPVYDKVMHGRDNLAVLDIGCRTGDGTFARFARNDSVTSVLGIDSNAESIEIAEKHFTDVNSKIEYRQCEYDPEALERTIADYLSARGLDGFDVVSFTMVLSTLPQPLTVLKAVKPFMNDKAKLIILDIDDAMKFAYPDEDGDFERAGKLGTYLGYASQRFTGRRVFRLLKDTGYLNLKLARSGFTTMDLEAEEKGAAFDNCYDYITTALHRQSVEAPEDEHLRNEEEWFSEAYSRMRQVFMDDSFFFHSPMMIFTATSRKDEGLKSSDTETSAGLNKKIWTAKRVTKPIMEEAPAFNAGDPIGDGVGRRPEYRSASHQDIAYEKVIINSPAAEASKIDADGLLDKDGIVPVMYNDNGMKTPNPAQLSHAGTPSGSGHSIYGESYDAEPAAASTASSCVSAIYDGNNEEIKLGDEMCHRDKPNEVIGVVIGIGDHCFFTQDEDAINENGYPTIYRWSTTGRKSQDIIHYRGDTIEDVLEDIADPSVSSEELARRFEDIVASIRRND